MNYTLSDIKTLVKEPVDLEAEDFISDAELTRYINAGIREAEAEIHNVFQDYYLAEPYTLQLVAGTSTYNLPEYIFANKIRKIIFDDESDTRGTAYIIKRVRNLEDIPYVRKESSADPERFVYLITNDRTNGEKIRIYPTPQSSYSTEIKIYYLREAKQLSSDSDVLDIPEFVDFVVLFARYEALKKELGNPLAGPTKEQLEMKREQMVNTLINRFPDGDSSIIQDTGIYEDFYYNYYNDTDY
jgi:hypothetical protein